MPIISLPEINSEVYIGFIGDSPVTFGDLGLMKGYRYKSREYVFPVASRSQVSAINVHEMVSTKDGWKGTLTLPNTDGKLIAKLAIEFFDKEVWEKAKEQYSEKEKWNVFGYFMTDYMMKCLGRKFWNNDCCVYWSDVCLTLKV